jgi:hypothetical protein
MPTEEFGISLPCALNEGKPTWAQPNIGLRRKAENPLWQSEAELVLAVLARDTLARRQRASRRKERSGEVRITGESRATVPSTSSATHDDMI